VMRHHRNRHQFIPHVIYITLISAEGLPEASTAYILANSLDRRHHSKKIYSTAKSQTIVNSSNPVFDEDMRLFLCGSGHVTLNMFNKGTWSDSFLGQVVLNMHDFPQLYSGECVTLKLKLTSPTQPIFSTSGKAITAKISDAEGYIRITMRIPSISANMCGLFLSISEKSMLFFNDVRGKKIWVVLSDDELLVFSGAIDTNPIFDTSSPHDGVQMRLINCADIEYIDESVSDQVEIQFERLTLKLKSGEVLNWAWGADSSISKRYWRQAFRQTSTPSHLKLSPEI